MKQRFFIITLLFLLIDSNLFAQSQENAVEEFFRTESKFYVVVAVLAIVMIGLLGYVIYLDRKTKKLEKQIFGEKNPFFQDAKK